MRATSLSPPELFLLDEWCDTLRRAFGEAPYLVGSVARAETSYRDVDIRMMLAADHPLLSVRPFGTKTLSVAVSMWGQRVTGLPIDFQFQEMTTANDEFGGEVRNARGLRLERRGYTRGASDD